MCNLQPRRTQTCVELCTVILWGQFVVERLFVQLFFVHRYIIGDWRFKLQMQLLNERREVSLLFIHINQLFLCLFNLLLEWLQVFFFLLIYLSWSAFFLCIDTLWTIIQSTIFPVVLQVLDLSLVDLLRYRANLWLKRGLTPLFRLHLFLYLQFPFLNPLLPLKISLPKSHHTELPTFFFLLDVWRQTYLAYARGLFLLFWPWALHSLRLHSAFGSVRFESALSFPFGTDFPHSFLVMHFGPVMPTYTSVFHSSHAQAPVHISPVYLRFESAFTHFILHWLLFQLFFLFPMLFIPLFQPFSLSPNEAFLLRIYFRFRIVTSLLLVFFRYGIPRAIGLMELGLVQWLMRLIRFKGRLLSMLYRLWLHFSHELHFPL